MDLLTGQELLHLQNCELFIADEIKRICVKNQIEYFMVAGTFLGAVRHKGFIPWDDDMDFGMRRSEYEKFCEVCKTELGREFYFQTWDNNPDYPFLFGKMHLKGTSVNELFAPPNEKKDGIFVDIFPFDNVSDDPRERKIQEKEYFFYKRAMWIKKGYGKNLKNQSIMLRMKYYVFEWMTALVPYEWLKEHYNAAMQKYNGRKKTRYLVYDAPYSFKKNMIKREWIEEIEHYTFEDRKFPAFKDYDSYLRHLYGDYMRLPALEDQHSHGISEVDFAQY